LLKQITHCLADGTVVVDDEYGGSGVPSQTQPLRLRTGWRDRVRLGNEAVGKACQLLGPNRLVQMGTALTGNLTQAIARDVTRQDDGRDCVPEPLLQPCDHLEPVDALRQIVVCDDEIRHGRPLVCQFESLVRVGSD
jgi:hypothetical protein